MMCIAPTCQLACQASGLLNCSSCSQAAIAKQQLPHRQLNAIPQRWYFSAGCAKNPKKLHSQNPMLPTVLATCIHQARRKRRGVDQEPWQSRSDSSALVMNRVLPTRKGALHTGPERARRNGSQ